MYFMRIAIYVCILLITKCTLPPFTLPYMVATNRAIRNLKTFDTDKIIATRSCRNAIQKYHGIQISANTWVAFKYNKHGDLKWLVQNMLTEDLPNRRL
jgi:hypothetical protein